MQKEVLLSPFYIRGSWGSEMLACPRPRHKWSMKLEFKPRSGCKAPPSSSSNWIPILHIGFAKQKLPSEKLALQPEWSFQVQIWFRHPQSPPPAFQRLRIADRKIETLGDPEALWSNPSSCARCTVRPNKLKRWSLEQGIVYCKGHARRMGGSCPKDLNSFFFFLIDLFIYLFLAALGLCCCVRAFSSCGERGLLFVAVRGLLTRWLLLLRSTGSRHAGFSSCGTWAQ